MIPAIILSSSIGGLGVIRALGQMSVPIVVVYHYKRDMGYGSLFVREKFTVPHPEKNEREFIDMLLDCSRKYMGSILIPTSDEMLAVVSRNKEILQEKYIIACSEWEIIKKCLDKKYTYAIAEEIGIPIPKTFIPNKMEEVEELGHVLQYPCIVKPTQSEPYYSRFRRKMVMVSNLDQMLQAYNEGIEANLELIIQEFIPGGDDQGANYNSYFWDGMPICEFTARKIRSAPPVIGSPCVLRSEIIPEIIEPGRKILKALGYYGYSCMEFKQDCRDGIYKLMEINARHNLSSSLAVECGLNFPWIQYKHLLQGEVLTDHSYQTGLYWIDITRDIYYGIRNWVKDRKISKEWFTPYIKPHTIAVFNYKDPIPALIRMRDAIRIGISYLSKQDISPKV